MRTWNNEKGIALVTTLMLTLIALAMTLLLLYIATQNTTLSGSQKRYRNSLQASYGGVGVITDEVIPLLFKDYSSTGAFTITKNAMTAKFSNIGLTVISSDSCLSQKLGMPTSNWASCSAAQQSSSLASIKSSPDITFVLKGATDATGYRVYTKIVETMAGNTDTSANAIVKSADVLNGSSLLSGTGAAYNAATGTGGVRVEHIPVKYHIEVQGERATNTAEKSNLSVLYAY